MEREIQRRRSRLSRISLRKLRLSILQTLQPTKKAERHKRDFRRRHYYRIRSKHLIYMTFSKQRFKKIKKVENQTIFGVRSEILEMILSQLGTQHLKVCRLVCKSWNQEACRVLRKKSVVELRTPQMCLDLHRLINNGRILQLPHPFADLSVYLLIPDIAGFETPIHLLKKYHVRVRALGFAHHETLMGPARPADSYLRCFLFLKELAPALTHLFSPLWACELPKELQGPYLSLQFPNLETLHLDRSNPPLPNEPFEEEECLRRILATSPKLVNLSFSELPSSSKPGTMLDLKNIQKLNYYVHSSLSPLVTFASTCNSIKSLSLDCTLLEEDEFQLLTLKQIIARVGASLEILNLSSDELALKGDLPDCPQLHRLYLTSYYPYQLNIAGFSSLKSLEFEDIYFTTAASKVTTESQAYLSVEELKVYSHSLQISGFERLYKLFPNVISWEVPPELLEFFCRAVKNTMKKIQKLRLRFWGSESTEVCKNLLHLQDLEELDLVGVDALSEAAVNIFSQLTNLKILRMSDNSTGKVQMQAIFREILQHEGKVEPLDKRVFLNPCSRDNFELICAQITAAEFQTEEKKRPVAYII